MSEASKPTFVQETERKIRDALGWLEQYAKQNDEPYLVTEAIADLHYALRYLRDANGP